MPAASLIPNVTNPLVSRITGAGPMRTSLLRAYNFALKRAGPRMSRTYFGARMLCDPNDFVQRMILNFGFWEPNLSAFIAGTLRPGDVFADIGANIGYDTLLGARLVGPEGAVVSIEASPAISALLTDNVALNGGANVRIVNVAVSDAPGVLELFAGPATSLGETTTIAARGFARVGEIRAEPLDVILSPDERARLRLIKMDIEGAEPPVLRRLVETLDLYPETLQVLTEMSPQDDCLVWTDIFAMMARHGFSAYCLENEYSEAWYMNWRNPAAPVALSSAPTRQCDVVFSRQAL